MTPEEREAFLRECQKRIDLLRDCDPDGLTEVMLHAASVGPPDEAFKALVLRSLRDVEE